MSEIIIQNSNVVVQNPPPPHTKHFKRCLKIGKLRFYITWDYRLRNSQQRDNVSYWPKVHVKEKIYKTNEGKCEMCGKKLTFKQAKMHHVLPYHHFLNLALEPRNIMLLCNECHRSIHTNPFLDCKLQRKKAKELGINIKECYYE